MPAFLFQPNIWDLVSTDKPLTLSVFLLLVIASLMSWSIFAMKVGVFKKARLANIRFLRAFRKAASLEQLALASEQFRGAPMVAVFDFGYSEVERQLKARGTIFNKGAVDRNLQIGISEEVSLLERNLNILATIATVTPFIGLFGTVWGIIDAFQALSMSGTVSLRTVGPGIADALVATAIGLGAAIPAAVFYNYFGARVKEMGARMEDFSLEFMNMTERMLEG